MIDYILFDMDGLLVDSESLSFEIICGLAAQQGYTLTQAQYCTLIGQSQQTGIRVLSELSPKLDGQWIYDQFRVLFFEAVKAGRLRRKPGVTELLDVCDARGIKRAVVSSNLERYVRANLASAGIDGRFDAIVYDGMVQNAKPAPDLFLKGAELLGADDVSRCLVLEDSFAGVRAGHAAGMPVIVVPDLIQPTDEILALCVRKADSLLDVAEALDAL